jgi:cysteine desulfurase
MEQIYLDYAATTPVVPEVIDAVTDCLRNDFGNPSSMHRLGIQAEKRIKEAKNQVSDLLRVDPEEIIFTSGGTEANNMAILGTASDKKRSGMHCITTAIEHPSVLNTFDYLEKQGYEVTYLPVNREGLVSPEDFQNVLREDTILVSMMHVNNEVGSIQPVQQIGAILKACGSRAVFHVDGIQSFGKLPLYPREWGIDLVSLSGHKIHAPKGVGALYKKKGIRLQPILFGGGQQGGMRSGTENIAGIVGMGTGAQWIAQKHSDNSGYLYDLKVKLIAGIREALPNAVINGSDDTEKSAPHILNVGFPGLRGEVLLHALEEEGVYVSTGSACSSRDKKISHVLKALGLDNRTAEGSIRISISYLTTPEEIEAFVPILTRSVKRIEKFTRR